MAKLDTNGNLNRTKYPYILQMKYSMMKHGLMQCDEQHHIKTKQGISISRYQLSLEVQAIFEDDEEEI